MTPPEPLLHEDLAILLTDAQTSFFVESHGDEGPVIARLERLLLFARMLDLPVIATLERPVNAKGRLPARLDAVFPESGRMFEKSTFDALGEPEIADAVASLGRGTVAVAGTETDVCVLLTVLGLLRAGYRVYLLADCVATCETDPAPALERMYRAGAIPCTFKTLAYELTRTVDRSRWPAKWRERLAAEPGLFPEPENLPPTRRPDR